MWLGLFLLEVLQLAGDFYTVTWVGEQVQQWKDLPRGRTAGDAQVT